MIVGFDIDGVLYPWHEVAWRWYADNVDSDMSYKGFWTVPGGWIDKNDYSTMIFNIVDNVTLFSKKTVKPRILDSVKRIDNISDDIFYITGRPQAAKSITRKWLKDNGFPKHKQLLFSDDVGGKDIALRMTGCDYYAEDRAHYIKELSEIAIIFAVLQPYNRNFNYNDRVILVQDVQDMADYLERVYNESI